MERRRVNAKLLFFTPAIYTVWGVDVGEEKDTDLDTSPYSQKPNNSTKNYKSIHVPTIPQKKKKEKHQPHTPPP